MIVVTGASGQLGRLVIAALLEKIPAPQIVAAVRNPASVQDLAARGVVVREADYNRPETLETAFRGADKLLLISSSELGGRVPQHRAVIDAAKAAGVRLLAYTSILRADVSPLGLAAEHRETENYLRASGLPFVLLRNGWYSENYTASVPVALEHGVVLGSAGNGRISSAARADYAAAASDPRDDVVVRCRVRDQADAGWELAAEGHLGRNFGGTITSDGGAPHKLEVLLRFQLWRFFDRRLPAPVGQIRDDKRVIAAMLLARPEKIWLAKDVAPREQEAALALLAGLRLLPIGLDVG